MPQKLWLVIGWLFILFLFVFLPADKVQAAINELGNLSAHAYVLMDADSGQVLASRNASLHLPPASMTKLMTLLLAMEAIEQGKIKKTDRIVASAKAASMDGTRIYLEPGEVMPLDDMLISMALASANDASVAVAEKLSGSEEEFVKQMNQKAKTIGMKDSCFKNVSGMPALDHYSSAYDMALLARYTIANTPIIAYSSLKEYNLRQGEFPIYNGNKLLWRYPGADGLKIGYTSKAKNCLTATAKRGKLRLIVVVMGCPLKGGQTADAMALLDYGFNHYASARLMSAGKVCATVKVKNGSAKEVQAVVADEVNAIYPKNQGIAFTCRHNLLNSVGAPVKRGQKIGEMQIIYNGKLLKTVDLLAAANIKELRLLGRIWRIPWGYKLLVLFIMIIYAIRRFKIRRNQRQLNSKFRSARY